MVPSAGQGTGGHKVGSQLLPLCVWHSLMSKSLRHVLVFKASANACAPAASSILLLNVVLHAHLSVVPLPWLHNPLEFFIVDSTIQSRDHTNVSVVFPHTCVGAPIALPS